MRPMVSVFIATSLDGYIARPDGLLDWLDQANTLAPKGEDCGYQLFIATVDALVMGRHSYEKVLSFNEWPYITKQVVVLSSSDITIPDALRHSVNSSKETPRQLLTRLHAEGMKHIYLDGGVTIQHFLRDGLVDELTITTIPVLLGKGRPLFGDLDADITLELKHSKAYPFAYVQSTYRVVKK